MKKIITLLLLAVGLMPAAYAQQPKQLPGEHYASTDISITGTYKIKEDQMTIACSITNNSTTVSYKGVIYQIKFIDQDGKTLSSANYTWNDPIGPGETQKQKKADYTCPLGTKTLSFGIVDGTKFVDNMKKK